MTSNLMNWLQKTVYYLAVANLYLLPFWVLAFSRNGMPTDTKFVAHFYELSQIFDHVDYFAALFLTAIVAGLLLAIDRLGALKSEYLAGRLELVLGITGLAILAMAVCIVAFRPTGDIRLNDGWMLQFAFIGTTVAALLFIGEMLIRGLLSTVVRYCVLATAPLFFVFLINAVVAAEKVAAEGQSYFSANRSLAPILPSSSFGADKKRIVAIVFDMWDYKVSFEDRPEWLKLPNLDALISQSLSATQAIRAGLYTSLALPSMIAGRKVYWSWPVENDDLEMIMAERYGPQSWRAYPGLFKTVRENGYNTSVIATAYHPYCRLFRQYVTDCWVDDTPFEYKERTVFNRMDNVIVEVLRYVPFVNRFVPDARESFHDIWGIHLYFAFSKMIADRASDSNFDFVFVHPLLPHPPFIRHFKTGEWQYFDEKANRDHYLGNLKAVDILLGKMREQMKAAGLWDESYVLLTADHGYSLTDWPKYVPELDPRVPFILKFPHQQTPVTTEKRFLLTSFRSVIEGIARGELTEPKQINQFIEVPDYLH